MCLERTIYFFKSIRSRGGSLKRRPDVVRTQDKHDNVRTGQTTASFDASQASSSQVSPPKATGGLDGESDSNVKGNLVIESERR